MSALGHVVDAVAQSGPISFSRYMELALYHPDDGFYADGGAGRRRDFITSPEVGPLFGAVVANALDTWWDEAGQPGEFHLVEVGAGPGTLARTILKAGPRCQEALNYTAVEPSHAQRQRHPDQVQSVSALPERVETGVVLANELLDNLPFDVVDFHPDRGWSEVRIGADDDALCEVLSPCKPPAGTYADDRPFRMPLQTAAARFVVDALATLGEGRLIIIDYAVPTYPVFDRTWLRTYAEHERAEDPLEAPGRHDITADVDLSALAQIANPHRVTDQAMWLRSHGIDQLVDEGRQYWTQHAARPDLMAMLMQSRGVEAGALLDPDGLGGFSVVEWVAA